MRFVFLSVASLGAACGVDPGSQPEGGHASGGLPQLGESTAGLRPGQLCTPWRGDESCALGCADRSLETWDWCHENACYHKWEVCGGDVERVARSCTPMTGGESCAAGCEDGTPETDDWCFENACYHKWIACGLDVVTPYRPCVPFVSRVICSAGCDDGNVETSDSCYDDVCFHSWMVCG